MEFPFAELAASKSFFKMQQFHFSASFVGNCISPGVYWGTWVGKNKTGKVKQCVLSHHMEQQLTWVPAAQFENNYIACFYGLACAYSQLSNKHTIFGNFFWLQSIVLGTSNSNCFW